ncbi:hypothetical protein STIB_00430 [Streptomyces sp. IB2014 011-1]|nr:hypothetical protein STIB_00430 [Streptomyces sp. IB2014 011-1]
MRGAGRRLVGRHLGLQAAADEADRRIDGLGEPGGEGVDDVFGGDPPFEPGGGGEADAVVYLPELGEGEVGGGGAASETAASCAGAGVCSVPAANRARSVAR